MTVEQILSDIVARQLDMHMHTSNLYGFSFYFSIKGKYDGVEISCEESFKKGDEYTDVVERCYTKWMRAANSGCGGLIAPPVEATVTDSTDADF
jgi:hypothetical protein